jgi:copper resistance protein B
MKSAITAVVLALGLATSGSLRAQDQHVHDPVAQEGPAHAGHVDPDMTSAKEHVAPSPPQLEMHEMPYSEMTRVMGMDDRELSAHAVIDQLEWTRSGGQDGASWDGHAWFGRDEGRIWLNAEGESTAGTTHHAEVELVYDRYIARWWSLQAGPRVQYGDGPSRNWLALGVRGLAPYFFDLAATAYLGEGRAAFKLKSEYELLFTQRLILQPFLEFNLHSEDDPERQVGSGLSDAQLGLRLRYEIRRQFAPYIGMSFNKSFGETGELVRQAGGDATETQFVAGLRVWF